MIRGTRLRHRKSRRAVGRQPGIRRIALDRAGCACRQADLVVESLLPELATRLMQNLNRLRWNDVYREAELYKAAVRVYTKPLFQWRKALNVSTDGKTLYDLAGRGLRGLHSIHLALKREEFRFRPSVGLKYNFNGKRRTLYIPPWEERIVDLLLYRLLNRRLHGWFSPNSYAYRDHTYGLDGCQSRIAEVLRRSPTPLYVVKRDVSDYFGSVNHEILLAQLAELVDHGDYLFRLLEQRIRFAHQDESGSHQAGIGIPFGCASACLFANIYLTEFDRAMEAIGGVQYFRYADDILVVSAERQRAIEAAETIAGLLRELQLTVKPSHNADLLLGNNYSEPQGLKPPSFGTLSGATEVVPFPIQALKPVLVRCFAAELGFNLVNEFRHLGLQFQAGGGVSLSRDKSRKIQNLFRFAFRRKRRTWKKVADRNERARTLAAIAADVIENGVRNVAIIDYYLKHVTDIEQLNLLDRWLAEEILSLVFGGHKKGHFAKVSFGKLREFGLPSLVHRRRLIVHGHTSSPFFIWKQQKSGKAFRGTVARLVRTASAARPSPCSQKQQPIMPVGEGGCL